ncbi:unnamed protein product [Peronospora destructor]|uniref:MRH domain-containing protein n=1 Tax=Peronospora destructor TaxID=86335 RepID=A0AAV0VES7_9STRA|nr:unnamed protein product [Peronospora destructor]
MTRRILAALAALSSASDISASSFASSLDALYVVQLHSTRDGLSGLKNGTPKRSQLITTESGQTFECFFPPLPLSNQETEDFEASHPLFLKESKKQQQTDAFLAFGRAAVQRVRPQCIQYTDIKSGWLYEVCVGILIRHLVLQQAEVQIEAIGATSNAAQVAGHEEELGTFVTESSRPALIYDEFVMSEMQDRVTNHHKPLFTQTFGDDKQHIHVQFICSTTAQDDAVSAVQWRADSATDGSREIAALLVASRVFCNPLHSDADDSDLFTVRLLLQPLEDAQKCLTRTEGWWTYEFCFGSSVRQYHRNADGHITAEFSLGMFDAEGNRELERTGSALVSEYIDATHDVPRPAYLELYDDGTFCRDSENHVSRKTKIFYYCSQGGTSHQILTVKEMQTCTYTLKVSSPVLCDHPHFYDDEETSNQGAEILHCIPAVEVAAPTAAE